MGARGKYAGQPRMFTCAKCRRLTTSSPGGLVSITTTGRTRQQLSAGANYHHWPSTAYEYRCEKCGHVGWSRHPSIQRLFEHEHKYRVDRETAT
jgi:hypothetical protein